MNYIYIGSPKWEASASFVIRGALSERKGSVPPKQKYQKILVLVWSCMMLVLICAYKGDFISIITKPIMDVPFTNADGMVKQTQIKWGTNAGNTLFISYAKAADLGTTLAKISDQIILFPINDTYEDSCYRSAFQAKKSRDTAAICDITNARHLIANEYSKTGSCNYYMTQDKTLSSGNSLAFQVRGKRVGPIYRFRHIQYTVLGRKVPLNTRARPEAPRRGIRETFLPNI